MSVHSSGLLDVPTSTPIRNQVVSRYCATSLRLGTEARYVELRYAPREPSTVNLDTSNNKHETEAAPGRR
jgi:hypothetical protein